MVNGTFITLKPQANNPLSRVALVAAPWLAILVLWYAVRASGLVNPALVPAPHAVFAKFIELSQDRLAMDVWMSTQRVFVGVFLGVLVAVPVGFAIGWYRGVRTFVDPLINFFRALPPIALIPLVIVYFGIGEVAKTVILFYASFFAGVIVMVEGDPLCGARAHAPILSCQATILRLAARRPRSIASAMNPMQMMPT